MALPSTSRTKGVEQVHKLGLEKWDAHAQAWTCTLMVAFAVAGGSTKRLGQCVLHVTDAHVGHRFGRMGHQLQETDRLRADFFLIIFLPALFLPHA